MSKNKLLVVLMLFLMFVALYFLGVLYPNSIIKYKFLGWLLLFITLFSIFLSLILRNVLNKINQSYQNNEFNRCIKLSKLYTTFISGKRNKQRNYVEVILSACYLTLGDNKNFIKTIQNITDDEYHLSKKIWMIFYYLSIDDFDTAWEEIIIAEKVSSVDKEQYIKTILAAKTILEIHHENYSVARQMVEENDFSIKNPLILELFNKALNKLKQ